MRANRRKRQIGTLGTMRDPLTGRRIPMFATTKRVKTFRRKTPTILRARRNQKIKRIETVYLDRRRISPEERLEANWVSVEDYVKEKMRKEKKH